MNSFNIKQITYVAIASTFFLSFPVNAQSTQALPVNFQHGEWQLVCDNTRTCRAVGYQDDYPDNDNGISYPVALMLKRQAGENQRVRAYVMFGDDPYLMEDAKKIPHCTPTSQPTISINGQGFGVLGGFDNEDYSYELNTTQIHALINTLPTSSNIEFVADCYKFVVSDTGSTAVLLKMDEVQGRIGTKGAIVQRGNKSESSVLPALAVPKVRAIAVDDKRIKRTSDRTLFNKLSSNMNTLAIASLTITDNSEISDFCDALTDANNEFYRDVKGWNFYRLNDHQLLAEHSCWRAAYNEGYGYWLMNDKPPYDVTLITDSGVDYENGEIFYGHKGRGIGDCISIAEWRFAQTHNGTNFIKISESTTGMCKSIAAGGAFGLPTIVTEVVEER